MCWKNIPRAELSSLIITDFHAHFDIQRPLSESPREHRIEWTENGGKKELDGEMIEQIVHALEETHAISVYTQNCWKLYFHC